MIALLSNPLLLSRHLNRDCRQQLLSTTALDYSLTTRHCLCCSNVSLRHIRKGKLYWRCSHCHEEMPVF